MFIATSAGEIPCLYSYKTAQTRERSLETITTSRHRAGSKCCRDHGTRIWMESMHLAKAIEPTFHGFLRCDLGTLAQVYGVFPFEAAIGGGETSFCG